MTAYTNFIQDFPSRALEILERNYDAEKANDREVTLMLMIATSAFVVPFERLRAKPDEHPANDVGKYVAAKNLFDDTIKKSFRRDKPWLQRDGWQMTRNVDGQTIRESGVETWAAPDDRKDLAKGTQANEICAHIRNALAHGNIYTLTDPNTSFPRQITEIVLLSQRAEWSAAEGKSVSMDKYNVLYVAPRVFCNFLITWTKFLMTLDLANSANDAH